MLKPKWLDYAVGILRAAHLGARSIKEITEELGGSESYAAKIIAQLRAASLIDDTYELTKKPEDITIAELLQIGEPAPQSNTSAHCIWTILMSALELPITQIW